MSTDSMLDGLAGLAVDRDDPEAARVRAAIASRLLDQPMTTPRIGRFTVLERLGAGGMGIVYSAFDPQLDRKVALKLLFGRSSEPIHHARLVREARAMAKLSHPNVVQVYEVGEHGGRIFLAMEYVHGRTLRVWLTERARTWREVLAMCIQAGHGLEAAHRAGIVHRDFKPDNVLVGDDGRARVLDFGLSRDAEQPTHPDGVSALSGDEHVAASTRTGTVLGTPGYMAPEQMRGETVDAHSDQFSFCVTVWEALTGALPYAGKTVAAVLHAVDERRLVAPLRAKMPHWVEDVLRRGLDARTRFPSLTALLAALDRDPAQRLSRRLMVVAAVVCVIAAFVVGAWYRGDERCTGATAAVQTAWPDADREAALARIGEQGGEFGRELVPELRVALEQYAGRWIGEHDRACLGHARGELSADLLDRRMTCLRRELVAYAELGEIMAGLEPNELARIRLAAAGLPEPDRCTELDGVDDDAVTSPEGAELEERIERGYVQLRSGRIQTAVEASAQVVALARELGEPIVLAKALRLHAGAIIDAGDREGSVPELREAVTLALAAGADELAVEAWGHLAWATATLGGEYAAEVLGGRELVVAIAEHRPTSASTMSLYNNLGGVAMAQQDSDTARIVYRRSVDIARTRGPSARPTLAAALGNLAMVSEDPAERDAMFEAAIATWTEVAGPAHPRTLTMRSRHAGGMLDAVTSAPLLAEACRELRGYHPALRSDIAECERELSDVAERAGDPVESRAANARWLAAADPEERDVALAYAALRDGDAAVAATKFAAQLDAFAQRTERHWWDEMRISSVELGLGRARRAMGHADGDVTIAQGVQRLETLRLEHPVLSVDRRIAMARAVAAAAPDRVR